MRNLKKVLTLVLTVAMLLSVMVVGTGAAFSDQSSIKNTEAVDACVALNIIGGFPDGTYRPTNNVTRAEMCKMICIALNGGKEPNLGTNNTPTFSDVRGTSGAWAEAYIESCNSQGIVSGVGGGRFSPNGNITGTQAARMLLVTLGYNATTEQFTGDSWAVNVNIRATQKGLYKGIEGIDTNAALTRDSAAQMIKNALDAKMVTYKNEFSTGPNGQIIATPVLADKLSANGDSVTLLGDKYEAITVKAQFTAFDYNSNKGEWTYTIGIGGDARDKEGNIVEYAPRVTSTTDYTDLLGQKVQVVYTYDSVKKQNVAYGIFVVDSKVVTSALVGDLPKLTDNTATSVKLDGTTYKLEDQLDRVPVYQFTNNFGRYYDYTTSTDKDGNTIYTPVVGSLWTLAGQDANKDNITAHDAQKFTAVDYDGNGKIDFFMIVPFEVLKVTYVSSTQFALEGMSKTDLDDVSAYDGMKRNDYVVFTAAKNTADGTATLVKADLVSGTISSTDSPNAQIDNTWYTFDASYATTNADCKAGNTLNDAVVVNGYIFAIDKINKTNITDFAVVVGTDNGGVSGNQAKLLFSNGDKTVVTTNKNYHSGPDAIANGTLVTYSKNADGDYVLTKLANKKVDGYDLSAAVANVGKLSNDSSKVGYINGAAVNDDAVIFVNYDGTSYKTITGAQLKRIATSDVDVRSTDPAWDNGTNGLVLGSKSGNTYNVEMAYIRLNTSSVNDADTHYGYIMGVTNAQNDDKQNVNVVKLWTKDGEKSIEFAGSSIIFKHGSSSLLKAGSVMEYKLNDKDKISEVVSIFDVDGQTALDTNGNESAATIAISALEPTFQFNIGNTSYVMTNGKYFELTKDTVYLYIENTDQAGEESSSLDTASKDEYDNLINNAFIIYDNTDGSVKLVVYDVDGVIKE